MVVVESVADGSTGVKAVVVCDCEVVAAGRRLRAWRRAAGGACACGGGGGGGCCCDNCVEEVEFNMRRRIVVAVGERGGGGGGEGAVGGAVVPQPLGGKNCMKIGLRSGNDIVASSTASFNPRDEIWYSCVGGAVCENVSENRRFKGLCLPGSTAVCRPALSLDFLRR